MGKACCLTGASGPRIQKKCHELLVYSHPRNFPYQFVSLELKSLESVLIPLRQRVNICECPWHKSWRQFFLALPASSSASANFWPLGRLFKVTAITFQNVWNVFLTSVNLLNQWYLGSQLVLAALGVPFIQASPSALIACTCFSNMCRKEF